MKETTLILGSAGFVGDHLFNEMKNDEYVYFSDIFKNDHKNYIKCDITKIDDVSELLKIKPDKILFLSAQSSVKRSFEDPIGTFRINVTGLLNVLETIRVLHYKPYIVYVSSIEVYKKGNAKINEKTEYDSNNPYSVSKITAENLINLYKKMGVIDGIIVQPVPHIGPGQSRDFSISSFASQIVDMRDKEDKTLYVGNIDIVRDIIDVRDVIKFYKKLLAEKPSEFDKVIVATGEGRNYKDIIESLINISNIPGIKIEVDPKRLRPVDNPFIVASPSYTLGKLYWKSEIPFEKTLSDILKYWRDNS